MPEYLNSVYSSAKSIYLQPVSDSYKIIATGNETGDY